MQRRYSVAEFYSGVDICAENVVTVIADGGSSIHVFNELKLLCRLLHLEYLDDPFSEESIRFAMVLILPPPFHRTLRRLRARSGIIRSPVPITSDQ